VLTNVEISGSVLLRHAPERIPDVFEGAPLVAAVAIRAEGGELVVRGQLARESWEQTIRVAAQEPGTGNQAIRALYARERVADVEANALFSSVDGEVEELGVTFQIATRMTSWVAIDEASKVTGPSRDQLIPQELPYGTSASAFGLRGSTPQMRQTQTMAGTIKGKVSLEMLMGSVASAQSYDRSDEVGEGSVSPPGASDDMGDGPSEPFGDVAAPASIAYPRSIDVLASVSRHSGGSAEERSEPPEAESFEDGSFEREEPTGVRARRSTQAGAPPPPASLRASVMAPMKSSAPRSTELAPAKKEAVPQQSMPETRSYQIGAPGAIAPEPQGMERKAVPSLPAPQPTRAKKRGASLALWIAVLIALLALLTWWLLA
jgi:Ca-activated chloride channel family protein